MLAEIAAEGRAETSGWFGRFTGEAPPERLAVVRVAVFAYATVYLVARAPAILDAANTRTERFAPVGPISLLDSPVPASLVVLVVIAAIVSSAAACAGWRYRTTSVVAATTITLVLSYRLSWGQVLHTENLLVLHAILLVFMPAADAWALDAKHSNVEEKQPETWRYGWALQTLALATVLGYLIAAVAKFRNGGLDWMTGEVLRSHVAFDNVHKQLLGDVSSPLASITVPRGWLFPPMAIASIVVELGALVAMSRGLLRRMWVALIWFFHVAVLALMAILFPYQLLGIAFLPFLEGENIVRRSWPTFHRRLEGLRR